MDKLMKNQLNKTINKLKNMSHNEYKQFIEKYTHIDTIIFKNSDIYFFKGNMNNVTLNKEYKIHNQVKTWNVHMIGFLDDNNDHCCFYLKYYNDFVKDNIKVI